MVGFSDIFGEEVAKTYKERYYRVQVCECGIAHYSSILVHLQEKQYEYTCDLDFIGTKVKEYHEAFINSRDQERVHNFEAVRFRNEYMALHTQFSKGLYKTEEMIFQIETAIEDMKDVMQKIVQDGKRFKAKHHDLV